MKFRPSAVPLITADPYFSNWSFATNLYDDVTRHWTGKRHGMLGMVKIDGKTYRFMGKVCADNLFYITEPDVLPQKKCTVSATSTTYLFENKKVSLQLNFLSPLLPDDLALLSRPASYLHYELKTKDGEDHDITLYFEFSAEFAINDSATQVRFLKTEQSLALGNVEQKPLNRSGDNICIDWGYFHVAHKDTLPANHATRLRFIKNTDYQPVDTDRAYTVANNDPAIAVMTKDKNGTIVLAYDDVKSIEYFGEHLDAYYKTKYGTFENMLKEAVSDYEKVKKAAASFDKKLKKEAAKVNKYYEDITALTYRQAIAAHKIVSDHDGNILFLSKECFSNGCIATVDVTYPSIPLFLKYCPELVKGMLRPIFRFAKTSKWEYDFAPHDCGQYPLCNGQVYGLRDGKLRFEMQMPVEECGNMLICVNAVCRAENDDTFAKANKALLKQWADYLVKMGYNPENQLCTDDFAGHLAHNCNLGAKAILGIAAYAMMFNEPAYMDIAKEMATNWAKDAANEKGTKLAFDKEDSWSLKYNLVWDKLWDLNLFDEGIYANEIRQYRNQMNRYGVPLDSRSDYTKIDWLAWTTVLTDDKKYEKEVYEAIWNFICETPQRVPVTDWYFTTSGEQRTHGSNTHFIGFQNRTVVGGLFINFLK